MDVTSSCSLVTGYADSGSYIRHPLRRMQSYPNEQLCSLIFRKRMQLNIRK